MVARKFARKVLFPSCLIELNSLSPIKMTEPKEALEKDLKENRYQENIISKIFKIITNNHSLS